MKVLAILLAIALTASADVIRLRDGTVVEGQFLGASQSEIWFHRSGATDFLGRLVVPVEQVQSLVFSSDAQQSAATRPRSVFRYWTTILATAWFANSSAMRTAIVTSPVAGRSTSTR
jgi:hypothetical protein